MTPATNKTSRQSTQQYPWHNSSWNRFTQALNSQHLPHAILLSGAEHTGKTGFANRMVKSLLCESVTEQGACEQCRSCKTFEADAHPDFLNIGLVEDKQQIGVDQIRAMNQFLVLSRSYKGQRVVLIDEADRMNKNAANSLLKSLEEPADNSVIILITSNFSELLPTIKSRCQILHLATPDRQQSIKWLQQQTGTTSNFAVELDIAQGKPLLALCVDDAMIKSREALQNDLLQIVQEQKAITDIAKKWDKFDRETLIDWQIGWTEKLLTIPYQNNIKQSLINKKSDFFEQISEYIFDSQLWHLRDQILQQKRLVHTSVNSLILIENMLVLWLQAKQCK